MDKQRERLQKTIVNAKEKGVRITDVYSSLGIDRGNISKYLSGEDNILSDNKIETLINVLESPEGCATNQQRLSVSTPRKAANQLSNMFLDIVGTKVPASKRNDMIKEIEDWLRKVENNK